MRHRQRHDLGDRHGIRGVDPPRPVDRRPARGQRIAGHDVVVGDAATLQVAGRSPRTLGEHLAPVGAVFGRIGVDDHRRRALAFGGERLEAAVAVGIRVADDDDLARRIDAVLAQQRVVGRVAAVGVDDRRGHVARRREGRPGAADRRLRRVRILGVGVLAQRRHVVARRHHFDLDAPRVRRQHVVTADGHVFEPLRPPLVGDVLGDLPGARRGRDVRLAREVAMPALDRSGVGQRAEAGLDRSLDGGARRREAVHRRAADSRWWTLARRGDERRERGRDPARPGGAA